MKKDDFKGIGDNFDVDNAASILKEKGIDMPVDDLAMTMMDKDSKEYQEWRDKRQLKADLWATNEWLKNKKRDFLLKGSIYSEHGVLDHTFDEHKPAKGTPERIAYAKAMGIAYRIGTKREKFNAMLTGLPGRGKTYLAVSILNYIHENANPRLSCMFVSVAKMSSWELRAVKSNDQTEQDKVNNLEKRCAMVDVLVLDDLGSESVFDNSKREKVASDYTQKWLFRIAEARVGMTTIITTNLKGDKQTQVYDGKIVSRLMTRNPDNVVTFDNVEDHRNQPPQTGLGV